MRPPLLPAFVFTYSHGVKVTFCSRSSNAWEAHFLVSIGTQRRGNYEILLLYLTGAIHCKDHGQQSNSKISLECFPRYSALYGPLSITTIVNLCGSKVEHFVTFFSKLWSLSQQVQQSPTLVMLPSTTLAVQPGPPSLLPGNPRPLLVLKQHSNHCQYFPHATCRITSKKRYIFSVPMSQYHCQHFKLRSQTPCQYFQCFEIMLGLFANPDGHLKHQAPEIADKVSWQPPLQKATKSIKTDCLFSYLN